jgi:DNA-binding MarR family transcriptional regulator
VGTGHQLTEPDDPAADHRAEGRKRGSRCRGGVAPSLPIDPLGAAPVFRHPMEGEQLGCLRCCHRAVPPARSFDIKVPRELFDVKMFVIEFSGRVGRPAMMGGMERDSVDEAMAEWAREWPALDRSAMGVVNRIGRIDDHLDRRFKATLAAHDLSYYAFKLLATLRRGGSPYRMTPTELSRRLLVSAGAMTNQIDQLEAAGLVARRPDPDDRRVVMVELTAAGRQRIDTAMLDHAVDERDVLEPLAPDERAQLANLLRKLLKALETEAPRRAPADAPAGG